VLSEMSGNLNMNGSQISLLGEPNDDHSAAKKGYTERNCRFVVEICKGV